MERIIKKDLKETGYEGTKWIAGYETVARFCKHEPPGSIKNRGFLD
jgi:hypothetical protein